MPTSPEHWMRQAIALAREKMLANEGGPFGAVIVRNDELIAEGWNMVTSHNDPTAHAEIVAIRRACHHLGSFTLHCCELYSSCGPCPMCLAAAYWARIDRIYFAGTRIDAANAGFDDEWLYCEINRPQQEKRTPTSQLLQSEAQAVFQDWLNKLDRIPY